MHVRVTKHRRKDGTVRRYAQLVESFRREDGVPSHRVVAHLGVADEQLVANLRASLNASRLGKGLVEEGELRVGFERSLVYLPLAVVCEEFERFGLAEIVDRLCPARGRAAPTSKVLSALVAQRCVAPASKLAFQRWLGGTALPEILDVEARKLNDTRVHRVMDDLAVKDAELQAEVEKRVVARSTPRLLYLDLTDTWFEGRCVALSRRGRTKAGHRSKRKINIALLVNEQGLPMHWELLPGALSETTVLPSWIDWVHTRPALASSVLVFDRGLPCAANFKKLLDDETGHLFLTSVKSDSIPSFVELDDARLDELQRLDAGATEAEVNKACAKLQLDRYDKTTYARDVGLVQATKTNARKKDPLPPMRVYVYFNREIQLTKRERRQEKLDDLSAFVADLNETLANAKKSRTQNATHKKITRKLDRLSLSECFGVKLEPIDLAGKTKPIRSFRVHLEPREDMLRNMARRDGVTVLIAHPNVAYTVEEAIQAYRQKDVVEADFRTIKSVLDLRPVHHWKDEKVAAHVTICMLALLVERLLEARLGAHDDLTLPRTASALLEELEEVQLHRVVVNRKNHGGPTRATRRTKHLAKALTVTHLLAGPTTTATADRKVAV